MIRSYLASIAAMAATTLCAQPTITSSNVLMNGDQYTIALCSDSIDPVALEANTGAMYNWDFSGLTEVSENLLNAQEPTTTWWSYLAPNATECMVSWVNSHHTYFHNESGYLATGTQAFLLPPFYTDTVHVIYANNEQIQPLTFSYNDAFQDTYSGITVAFGMSTAFSGTIDFEADGYGTLELPTGTYNNVVRYHVVREHTEGNTETKDQWVWMSSDHRYWLLNIEWTEGNPTAQTLWYDKSPMAVGINEVEAQTITAFPNPVLSGSWVQLDIVQNDRQRSARVLDLTGRIVFEGNLVANRFYLEDVPAGPYFIQIQDRRGVVLGSMPLIVN